MNGILQTLLLGMTPIGELRAAIPVGIGVYHLNWLLVYLIAVIGNLVPIVFLLWLLEPVSLFLSQHFKIFKYLFNWLFARTRKKADSKIGKYGYPALVAFVAIPLPITGAWTGALIAFLFKIPFKKAFPLITAGVLIAGVIVTAITLGGMAVEQYLGWQALLAALVVIGIIWFVSKKLNQKIRQTKIKQAKTKQTREV